MNKTGRVVRTRRTTRLTGNTYEILGVKRVHPSSRAHERRDERLLYGDAYGYTPNEYQFLITEYILYYRIISARILFLFNLWCCMQTVIEFIDCLPLK